MNLENFAEYLKYPSRLYQLPYEELKSLTMQYPYCGNFHLLLVIKSKLEGHPDLEKNLAKAATYSIDRKYLRRIMLEEQMLPVESQITVGEDEILELKDLFTLDTDPALEKIPLESVEENEAKTSVNSLSFDLFPGEQQMPKPDEDLDTSPIELVMGENSASDPSEAGPTESFPNGSELPPIPEVPNPVPGDTLDQSVEAIPDAAPTPKAYQLPANLIPDISTVVGIAQSQAVAVAVNPAKEIHPAAFVLSQELIDDCIATSLVIKDWWERKENTATLEWEISPSASKPIDEPNVIPAIPTPKSNFQSYKKRYRRPLQKDSLPSIPFPPSPEEVAPRAKEVAEASIKEDLEVASETLAGLLVQQRQYERAIKMYEHLSLLIPEKNTYFAAKIDAIKNL